MPHSKVEPPGSPPARPELMNSWPKCALAPRRSIRRLPDPSAGCFRFNVHEAAIAAPQAVRSYRSLQNSPASFSNASRPWMSFQPSHAAFRDTHGIDETRAFRPVTKPTEQVPGHLRFAGLRPPRHLTPLMSTMGQSTLPRLAAAEVYRAFSDRILAGGTGMLRRIKGDRGACVPRKRHRGYQAP
jgi:hypothetical protein